MHGSLPSSSAGSVPGGLSPGYCSSQSAIAFIRSTPSSPGNTATASLQAALLTLTSAGQLSASRPPSRDGDAPCVVACAPVSSATALWVHAMAAAGRVVQPFPSDSQRAPRPPASDAFWWQLRASAVHVTRVGQHAWRGLPAMRHPGTRPLACASHAPAKACGDRPAGARTPQRLCVSASSSASSSASRAAAFLLSLGARRSRWRRASPPRRPAAARLATSVCLRLPRLRLRCTTRTLPCGHQTAPSSLRRTLSLAPTLRSRKGVGRVDCVLEAPSAPACAFSSFHTASKLPYSFQNVSSFRAPRDACNLMM
jgi:hypothetical protein